MTHKDLHELQKSYVQSMVFNFDYASTDAWKLIQSLWPKIDELPEEDGYNRYRIQMSPLANIFGAIICGDNNVEFHTNEGAVLQTLTLIGMCAAVTSHYQPGYALAKIKPEISFKGTVPVGASVIMATRKISERKDVIIFELKAHVAETRKELFQTPRRLTMYKITDSN